MSEILPEGLRILGFWGINPRHMHHPKNILVNCIVVFNSALTLAMMVKMIFAKWEGVVTIKLNADAIAVLYQILWKIAALVRHRKKLLVFIGAIEGFGTASLQWEEPLRERLRFLQGRVKKIYRAFQVMATVATCIYATQPLIFRQRFLPFHYALFCNEQFDWCYLTNYAYQLFVTVFTVAITIGGECLFFSLVSYIYLELEVVKYGFRNLDGDNQMAFSHLIGRHCIVLKFISDLNHIYQALFLHQFVSQVTFICFGVFDMCLQGFPPALPVIFKNIPILVAFHMELLIVTAAGEFLSNQSLAIADAIYESPWYIKHRPSLAKGIIIVMMRARKAINIKVGGLWNLEMSTFVVVVKTAVSVMTLMQTIYDFNEQ